MRGPRTPSYATPWLVVGLVGLVLAAPLALRDGTFASTPGVAPAPYRAVSQTQSDAQGIARILDGDTIEISGTRIRLEGIDAPEGDQACARAGGGAGKRHPSNCSV